MIRVWGAVERDGVIICEVRDIAGRAGVGLCLLRAAARVEEASRRGTWSGR